MLCAGCSRYPPPPHQVERAGLIIALQVYVRAHYMQVIAAPLPLAPIYICTYLVRRTSNWYFKLYSASAAGWRGVAARRIKVPCLPFAMPLAAVLTEGRINGLFRNFVHPSLTPEASVPVTRLAMRCFTPISNKLAASSRFIGALLMLQPKLTLLLGFHVDKNLILRRKFRQLLV